MNRFTMIAAFALTAFASVPALAETVTLEYNTGARRLWRIDSPNVNEPATAYPQIAVNVGEYVAFRAGGCVQTGGKGLTWKRYVSPSGANSATEYHGEILIPGALTQLTPMSYLVGDSQWSSSMMVNRAGYGTSQLYITLGYTDNNYGDNGYWGHDNGDNNQCLNQPNAWVEIEISETP